MEIKLNDLGSILIKFIFIAYSIVAIIKMEFFGLLFSTLGLGYLHLNSESKTYNSKIKIIKIISLFIGTILYLLLKLKWIFIDRKFIVVYSYI